MKPKIIAPIVGGIALVMIIVVLMPESPEPQMDSIDFTYASNLKIKEQLELYGLSMSSPLEIKGELIDEHCNFFTDSALQSKVEYCTSTELKDSQGNFLGNIHMVGDSNSPKLAMAIIQTDPFFSQSQELVQVYQTMIETLVCDCWKEKQPGDFESVSDWLQTLKNHHLDAKQMTTKSEITGLAQKQILLEMTTNTEGYLWKLLIDK